MEDLKQIQEFFSKPLEEGKQLDQVDFAKVVKAVEQTGHPVTVLLVPKFNEIEVITGMNAPDDILFDLSNAVDSLGYGRNDIFIAGDSSNLSRREYSDIRRVNGGAKDYFQEATKEEETEFHTKLDKLVHDTFGKRKGEMEEYNTGIYYDPAKEPSRNKAKEASKTALERVKDMIKKIASEQKMGEALADYEEKEANYDELYSDYKYKVDEAKPKKGHGEKISKEVFAKLKGKTVNYKGADYKVLDSEEAIITLKDEDGKTKTLNLKQFNDSGLIDEIIETVLLGRQLNEELCPKGKAYIKKRQAAGEKSSAYLSGRAVKVCKGQMKG